LSASSCSPSGTEEDLGSAAGTEAESDGDPTGAWESVGPAADAGVESPTGRAAGEDSTGSGGSAGAPGESPPTVISASQAKSPSQSNHIQTTLQIDVRGQSHR
jgi:hypothetical protein